DGKVLVIGRLAPITPPNSGRFPSGRYYVIRYLTDGSIDRTWKLFVSGNSDGTPQIEAAFLRANGNLLTLARFVNQLHLLFLPEMLTFDSQGNADLAFKPAIKTVPLGLPNNRLVVGDFPGKVDILNSDGSLALSTDVSAISGTYAT